MPGDWRRILTPDEGDAEQAVLADGGQKPHGRERAVGCCQSAETSEYTGSYDAKHQRGYAAVPGTM